MPVELLVALAILTTLVGITVYDPIAFTGTAKGKETAHEKNVVQSAIELYNTADVVIKAEPTIAAVATPQKCGPDNPKTFGRYLRRETTYRYSWSDNGEDLEVWK